MQLFQWKMQVPDQREKCPAWEFQGTKSLWKGDFCGQTWGFCCRVSTGNRVPKGERTGLGDPGASEEIPKLTPWVTGAGVRQHFPRRKRLFTEMIPPREYRKNHFGMGLVVFLTAVIDPCRAQHSPWIHPLQWLVLQRGHGKGAQKWEFIGAEFCRAGPGAHRGGRAEPLGIIN